MDRKEQRVWRITESHSMLTSRLGFDLDGHENSHGVGGGETPSNLCLQKNSIEISALRILIQEDAKFRSSLATN